MTIREEFVRDVARHQMEVMLESGGYRHLRFRQKASSNHWFDLIAWPGALCIDGDVGTFVFSRERDMFAFFGGDDKTVNPRYWAEKLVAIDREGLKRFSIARAGADAIGLLDNYDLSNEQRADVEAQILAVLEGLSDYDRDSAYDALFSISAHGVQFGVEDGPFGEEWQYHFLWCLHAIQWGIGQYMGRVQIVDIGVKSSGLPTKEEIGVSQA